MMRRYLKQAIWVRTCTITQCHEASQSMTAQQLRASLCSREENSTRSKFDLLSEVIFKDLAVPAVTVKLTLGS